jgi:Tfp pilus assembly protein PilV
MLRIVKPFRSTLPSRVTPKKFPLRATGGFTILEVMMAAIVMVLGITTSLTTLQYGFHAVDTARSTTLASQILQSQMEVLRLQNYTQICALTTPYTSTGGLTITAGNSATPTTLDTTLTTIADRFTFIRTVDAVVVGGATRPDIKLITLTVTWNGIDGRPHSLSYQLRYARSGLNDYLYVSH